MPKIDRRKLLQAGVALAVPFGGISLLSANQQTTNNDDASGKRETDKSIAKPEQEKEEKIMHIQFLEIVTTEADALCKQYSAIHGIIFGEPEASLGNARTAKLKGGGKIAIRGPLREDEAPVIRPYALVEDLEKAVAAAAEAGAEIAIPSMEIPGHGTIAIVIQGGIECGMWQE